MKKAVEYKSGFADGEVISYHRDAKWNVSVLFKTWNDKYLDILFEESLRLLDKGAGDISAFFEIDSSAFLQEAMERMFTEMPDSNPYKHYQFLDVNDEPCLEIVALSVKIRETDVILNKKL